MTSDTTTLSIRKTFAAAGVLLTGSTGFLAKAVAEKLLRDLPEVGQIYLLIRPRVKAWRENGYAGASGITRRLLEHWYGNDRDGRSRFFCK